MKIQAGILVSVLGYAMLPAAHASNFEDYARVINVTPQVERVNEPRQECRTEYVNVQRQQPRGVGGSILGGIAGGILGNQVGGGSGRTAATAAGAIAGAIVGDRVENNDGSGAVVEQQPVQRCRTVDHWENRSAGYAVSYEYQGHTYDTVLPYDPGRRLRVNVSVTPTN